MNEQSFGGPVNPRSEGSNNPAIAHMMNQLQEEQNFSMALMGGAVAATVGAAVWAAVTYFTGYQIGWMAIGIGFLVGFAVKRMGHGTSVQFGIVGAVMSFFGCLMGNIGAVCIAIAEQENIPLRDVLASLDFEITTTILIESFSPTDLLFYGFALYYGFRYSIVRPLDKKSAGTDVPPTGS